jgi:hypothetical protein
MVCLGENLEAFSSHKGIIAAFITILDVTGGDNLGSIG